MNVKQSEMDRRTFAKTVGVSAGALAVGATGATPAAADDDDDDDDDDGGLMDYAYTASVAPAALASSVFGGSDDDDDDPDAEQDLQDSLTESEQRNMYNWAVEKRRSNQAYIGKNAELLEGIQSAAYDEAQVAFVDAAAQGLSEEECLDAAHDEIYNFLIPVFKDFLNAWSDTVKDGQHWADTVDDILDGAPFHSTTSTGDDSTDGDGLHSDTISSSQTHVELPNGEYHEIHQIRGHDPTDTHRNRALFVVEPSFSDDAQDVDDTFLNNSDDHQIEDHNNHQFIAVADPLEWGERYDELLDILDYLETEVETFVSQAYGDWQAGEIDTDDLLTTAAMRDRIAEDESTPMAVADLVSLGASVDLERSYLIETEFGDGITWQLEGLLTPLNTPEGDIETGEVYDPGGDLGTTYLNHRPNAAVGTWDEYRDGIDGGQIEFTQEPPKAMYVIQTSFGETVTLEYDQFTEEVEGESYTMDLSDELDNAVAEITEVTVYWSDSDDWQQLNIPNEFEVLEITNQETDETVESAEFEQPWRPDEDTENRLDDEFLEDRSDMAEEVADNLEERFDEWEEALEEEREGSGFFGGSISLPGIGDIPVIGALAGGVVSIVTGIAGFFVLIIGLFVLIALLDAATG